VRSLKFNLSCGPLDCDVFLRCGAGVVDEKGDGGLVQQAGFPIVHQVADWRFGPLSGDGLWGVQTSDLDNTLLPLQCGVGVGDSLKPGG
jgi:hypothetical protein